ncbi:MAG: aspartate aminotransferase family protein [Oscillospiraceae bacterium]|nr:aspartate aminotransferase family protein [Oscillospiraceae bacterium]
MDTSVFERYESEVRSYCRSFPTVFSKAKGSILTDSDGKRYIDFFCGAGALNYGHNNETIKRRVIEYLENDGVTHALDMYTEAKRDFIDCFEQRVLIPRGLDYKLQFAGPTGTNAVEAALKLARKVKKRSNVFALMGCFHGMTLGALSLTTDAVSRAGAGVSLHDVTHIPAPYMFPGLDVPAYMQRLVDDDHSGVDKPAALILETVQAEGGVYVFDNNFLRGAEKFCRDNDILLIVDDIQVGCARTGTYFSFERAGIVPDITVMSKSIGGYGMPFSLVLLKPELDLWLPGEHNGTFRGYQPSMVAAKAGIEVMLNDRAEERARRAGERIGAFMENELLPMDPRLAARGIGCIWGVDMAAFGPGKAKAVSRNCFENGLIVELAGRDNSVVKLMPQLLISDAELDEGLSILKAAVAAVIA